MRRIKAVCVGSLGVVLLASHAGAVDVVAANLLASTDPNGATWGYRSVYAN